MSPKSTLQFFHPLPKKFDYRTFEQKAVKAHNQRKRKTFLKQLLLAARQGSANAALLLANGYNGNHSEHQCILLAGTPLQLVNLHFLKTNTALAYQFYQLTYMHAYGNDLKLAIEACEGIAYLGYITEAIKRLKCLALEFQAEAALETLVEIYSPSIHLLAEHLFRNLSSSEIKMITYQAYQALVDISKNSEQKLADKALALLKKQIPLMVANGISDLSPSHSY